MEWGQEPIPVPEPTAYVSTYSMTVFVVEAKVKWCEDIRYDFVLLPYILLILICLWAYFMIIIIM